MKIRFLNETLGAPDHIHVQMFEKDSVHEYDEQSEFVQILLQGGLVEVVNDDQAEEPPEQTEQATTVQEAASTPAKRRAKK